MARVGRAVHLFDQSVFTDDGVAAARRREDEIFEMSRDGSRPAIGILDVERRSIPCRIPHRQGCRRRGGYRGWRRRWRTSEGQNFPKRERPPVGVVVGIEFWKVGGIRNCDLLPLAGYGQNLHGGQVGAQALERYRGSIKWKCQRLL